MEIILKVLQGAYAYLLIFLVVVVSGHFLLLLWLIAQRIREAAQWGSPRGTDTITEAPLGTAQAQAQIQLQMQPQSSEKTVAPAAPLASATASVSAPAIVQGVPIEEVDALKAELTQLRTQKTELQATNDSSSELKERVKYLESKLLEYEILQEEITALSALKMENEELKRQVVLSQSVGAAPLPAKSDPSTGPELRVVSNESPALAVAAATPEKAPANAAAPPTVAPEASVSSSDASQLESLLSQIDELTRTEAKRL